MATKEVKEVINVTAKCTVNPCGFQSSGGSLLVDEDGQIVSGSTLEDCHQHHNLTHEVSDKRHSTFDFYLEERVIGRCVVHGYLHIGEINTYEIARAETIRRGMRIIKKALNL